MLGRRDFSYVIATVRDGFFNGFNRPVALSSVLVVTAVILWIILLPDHSTRILAETKAALLMAFRGWFLYCLGGIMLSAVLLACLPISGRLRLARDESVRPKFSTGSWLSMMFCAGVGVGAVVYAVAEPISHFTTNPELLKGSLAPGSAAAGLAAVKYTFLHWGMAAWACYAVLGLALGLFSYRYGLPLTIRTVVAPLLGRRLSGTYGHLIDGFSIVAILAGIATSVGYSVKSISAGLNYLAGGALFPDAPNYIPALLIALALCAVLSTLCVTSGVGRGMKWLSNSGTALFFVVMAYFALYCAPDQLVSTLVGATRDYVLQLPVLSLSVYNDTETATGAALATWQTDWTIFYWTWWLAFAPFVSLFIARISEGRTVREFILGSALAPCGVCFVWFACTGTASIALEMGSDGNTLIGRPPSEQLFAAIALLNSGVIGQIFAWTALALILILASSTFASGILAITTIAAAGDETHKPSEHVTLWSALAAMIIGALLVAGGTESIRDVMVISALPISVFLVLGVVSLVYVLVIENRRATIRRSRFHHVELKPSEIATTAAKD